jgi:hypothetical protein
VHTVHFKSFFEQTSARRNKSNNDDVPLEDLVALGCAAGNDSDDEAPLEGLALSELACAEDSEGDSDNLLGELFDEAPVNAAFLESDIDEDIWTIIRGVCRRRDGN